MSEMQRDPVAQHRFEVRYQIIAPVVLATIIITIPVIVLGVLVATDSLTMGQLTTTASLLAVVCVLLPLVLVMAVLDFGLIMLIWGSEKIPSLLVPVIRWLRETVQRISGMAQKLTGWTAEPVIWLEARLAQISTFLDGLIHWFDEPEEKVEND